MERIKYYKTIYIINQDYIKWAKYVPYSRSEKCGE